MMQNPVSLTAYFCAGARMLDAQCRHPLVGDVFAERFIGTEGMRQVDRFRPLGLGMKIAQVRCRLIDDRARALLAANPGMRVVMLGAGFDSRAYRLKGGRWVEIDEAAIIDRKNIAVPPDDCPNPLERVPIDFAREPLSDKLAPYATDEPTLVIGEGISMFLTPRQIEALAQALRDAFPRHWLICDVLSDAFLNIHCRPMKKIVAADGTRFPGLGARPRRLFERLGYRCTDDVSMLVQSLAMNHLRPFPPFVRHIVPLFPSLNQGNRLLTLEHGI